MIDYIVRPQKAPLSGTAFVPSDKSIAHRALVLAALSEGVSHVGGRAFGADVRATAAVLSALGVLIEETHDTLIVKGRGLYGFDAPRVDLDCGNSGTTMRLMAGVLAAQEFPFRLVGDASLQRRPMRRIVEPLASRGAKLIGECTPDGELHAPLVSVGRGPRARPRQLRALSLDLRVASAQVKSALLLSGLFADGPTEISEPTLSRDHTERMLRALGQPVVSEVFANRAHLKLVAPRDLRALSPFDLEVPGDLSAAAFLLAAAALVPRSDIVIERVGTNPTRTGMLDWLHDAGVDVDVQDEPAGGLAGSEPMATLSIQRRASEGRGAPLSGSLLVRAIDEVPALVAVAATLDGVTTVSDAKELRHKESDRLRACASVLRAFGVICEEHDDGLVIHGVGARPLEAAMVHSGGDHRVAMMATILALRASEPSRVRDVECIETSFPTFAQTLRSLGADVREVPHDA